MPLMPAPPITVQLTKFEHLEILRAEIETREGELKQLERQVREILFEMERQKYLQTVHAVFRELRPPADAVNLPQLQARRETVTEAVQALQATVANLERETAGQVPTGTARPATGAPGARPGRKFDSFEDFKANRG
jgi:chromosome segregation ATPase